MKTRLPDVFGPCTSLRTLAIDTPQRAAKKLVCDEEMVASFMNSMPLLRRFTLNDTHWEVRPRSHFILHKL